MPDATLAPVRTTFRAVATTVVPEASSLSAPEWAALETIVEHALARRPAGVRRQLQTLIRLVHLVPVLRYGRTFAKLSARHRIAVLHALERAPLLLLRRGVWGLRTLVLMGYYARPEAAAQVGYRATARGWEARR